MMISSDTNMLMKPKKKSKGKRENSASSIRSKVVAPVELPEPIFVRPHEDKSIESHLETSIEKKR